MLSSKLSYSTVISRLLLSRSTNLVVIRCHSSSSSSDSSPVIASESTSEQNSNATQATQASQDMEVKQHPTKLNEAHLNNTIFDSQPTKKPWFKTKQPFDHLNLPSVPTTKYIDNNVLKKDMLFMGFRPVLSPIKPTINYASNSKKQTIPLTWNISACKLKQFDDYSSVPQFIVDKLVPFNPPNEAGKEIIIDNLKLARLREENERKLYSKEVYEFLKHFRK